LGSSACPYDLPLSNTAHACLFEVLILMHVNDHHWKRNYPSAVQSEVLIGGFLA